MSAKKKKKKLTSQDADRGDAQKKGAQGASDTWKRVSAKKKKKNANKKETHGVSGRRGSRRRERCADEVKNEKST